MTRVDLIVSAETRLPPPLRDGQKAFLMETMGQRRHICSGVICYQHQVATKECGTAEVERLL